MHAILSHLSITNSMIIRLTIAASSNLPATVPSPCFPVDRQWFAGPKMAKTIVGASNMEMKRSTPISAPGCIGFRLANNLMRLVMAHMMDREHLVCRVNDVTT